MRVAAAIASISRASAASIIGSTVVRSGISKNPAVSATAEGIDTPAKLGRNDVLVSQPRKHGVGFHGLGGVAHSLDSHIGGGDAVAQHEKRTLQVVLGNPATLVDFQNEIGMIFECLFRQRIQ